MTVGKLLSDLLDRAAPLHPVHHDSTMLGKTTVAIPMDLSQPYPNSKGCQPQLRGHLPRSRHACERCPWQLSRVTATPYHAAAEVSTNHQCKFCTASFASRSALFRHIRSDLAC